MKKRTKYMLLLVIILGIISIITNGYSYAKYVSNSAWNYYLSTKGFYFTSEQLGTTKITNINNNWEYDRTYFTLKNSENNYLISDYDIEYTVKCTIQNDAKNYSECRINGTNSNTFTGTISSSGICKNNELVDTTSHNQGECETKGYKWIIQESYSDLYFDIIKTKEQEIDYVSALIEVETTSPYSKKISGEFNLSSIEINESSLKIDYKELTDYSRIIVSNPYNENKCVKLNWNSNDLRIDETKTEISSFQYDDNGYINEIKFNINKKDSISYVFYKNDFGKEYDQQSFTLVESNDC